MNMIERVARVIDPMQFKGNEETYRYCIDCGDDHEFAKDTSDKTFPLELAFERARDALDAMKEPTDDMLYDGAASHVRYYDEATEPEFQGAYPTPSDLAQLHEAYDAMIAAALDGK
jgi:hypothetical protein